MFSFKACTRFFVKYELRHHRRDRSGEVGVSVPVAGCVRGEEGDGIDSLGFSYVHLHEGVGGWVGCPRRRGLRVLPSAVFLRKVFFKLHPRLAFRWPLVPPSTCVGELARGEDQFVSRRHNLLWHVRDLSGIGKVHDRPNLFDYVLERLVDIVWGIHVRRVELEV